jgi:hypothetical protein
MNAAPTAEPDGDLAGDQDAGTPAEQRPMPPLDRMWSSPTPPES